METPFSFWLSAAVSLYVVSLFSSCQNASYAENKNNRDSAEIAKKQSANEPVVVGTAAYSRLQQYITNGDTSGRWPVKHDYPKAGAVLPFKRIVAYYGNLFSKKMGILGELPRDQMFEKLQTEVKKWAAADTVLPVVPALHYIAVVAQGAPGKDGKYRYRMPFNQIDTILNWSKMIDALTFVDIQVGLSTIQDELPPLEKYLSLPTVHLGIDPEFSMKSGARPGSVIGTYDAADINHVIDYLAGLVKKHNLPPKILVIHRFTNDMVTNYQNIKLVPEVQVVMDMDGWGEPIRKVGTYQRFIYPQPVQFTGFKIFYKNDTKRVNQPREMQPADVLKLKPQPVYIQYQ